jgi:hypothetical protein
MPTGDDIERKKGRGPDPRNEHVRAVLARSGNQCAFASCAHPIINEHNQFVAQLCHIEGAAQGGPRYNARMTEEERRSDKNLLLLCYRHHVETNDPVRFPVNAMREMKRAHEVRFAEEPYLPAAEAVWSVAREAAEYWARVDRANTHEHLVPELRIPIDASASASRLVDALREELGGLQYTHEELTSSHETLPEEVRVALLKAGYDITAWDALRGFTNPTFSRDWEPIHLSLPNLVGRMQVLIDQLEIRVLEQELALDPSNSALKQRILELRAAFLEGARMWGVVD